MPNSAKKQTDPGLEDELRKMILGNVRVHDDQLLSPSSPGRRHGNQSPRSQGFRSPKSPAADSHHHHSNDKKHLSKAPGFDSDRNGTMNNRQGNVAATPEGSWRHNAALQHTGSRMPLERPNEPKGNVIDDKEGYTRPPPRSRQLYQPNPRPSPRPPPPAIFIAQCEYLDRLATIEVAQLQMTYEEYSAKEAYRDTLERGFRQTLMQFGLPGEDILGLRGFGSFSSGFATANSDVDLAVVLRQLPGQTDEQFALLTLEMPRLLEKALLVAGFGARLLDRTRVPIIKTCQAPTPELLTALREERMKWDALPEEEKHSPKTRKENGHLPEQETGPEDHDWQWKTAKDPNAEGEPSEHSLTKSHPNDGPVQLEDIKVERKDVAAAGNARAEKADPLQDSKAEEKGQQKPKQKPWLRERPQGPLDFPKEGVGIQADINFSNALALHNTELLRCYSLCDPRVQPMVLFVKAWAKRRKTNSSYNGTLSSYGYVLMVLHFLINVAQPPVLPNLQLLEAGLPSTARQAYLQWGAVPEQRITCEGYDVHFLREPEKIKQLASRGLLTENQEPLGVLLRNFFHYYAHQGHMVIGRGFQWTSEVLSLRTQGGILTKEEKGWTGAKTTTTDNVCVA